MTTTLKQISFIVPAFNESERLKFFLKRLDEFLFNKFSGSNEGYFFSVVVIDDGSTTDINLDSLNFNADLYTLRHCVNLGQGAALQTGIEYARDSLFADYFVTIDADGQHAPEDFPQMLNMLLNHNLDIIFGDRFGTGSNVPKSRKLVLIIAKHFDNIVTGIKLNDAHNGYRVFGRKLVMKLNLTQNRMAHATEFKTIVAREKLAFAESKVKITYSEETLQKGQSNLGSLKILRDIVSSYLLERD